MTSPTSSSGKGKQLTQEEYYKALYQWISSIRKVHGAIRYYLKLEPYDMELWEWAHRFRELEWIRKEESKGGHG